MLKFRKLMGGVHAGCYAQTITFHWSWVRIPNNKFHQINLEQFKHFLVKKIETLFGDMFSLDHVWTDIKKISPLSFKA